MDNLWAIDTPSGLFAAPSKIEAEAKAAELNAYTRLFPGVPLVEVKQWTGSAMEHKHSLLNWASATRADA